MGNNILITEYYDSLKCTPTLNKGIMRLRNALEVSKAEMDSEQLELFNSFCDYVAFLEGGQKPFFSIVNNILSNRYSTLYKHLETNQESYKQLTAEEVFQLFKTLGVGSFREIIDAYNKFPSSIYALLVNSFLTDDLVSFENALGQCDCTVFTRTLWMLRFIIYGFDGNSMLNNGSRIKNLWLDDAPDFKYLFIKLDEEDNEVYEKIITKRLGGDMFRMSQKHRRYAVSDDIIKSEAYNYFNPVITVDLKNILSNYSPNKLSENRNLLLSSCGNLTKLVPLIALKNSQDDVIASKATESIEKGNWDWENLNATTFHSYVLSVANDMLIVYYNIEEVLNTNEKDILLWLMARVFGNSINNIIFETNNNHQNNEDQKTDLKFDKTNFDWFEKIPQSKLKGKDERAINGYLYESLQKLYNKFKEEKCISDDTEEGVFIYRLSGLYTKDPYNLSYKINTTDENKSKYGYIFRCLFEEYNVHYDKEGQLLKDKIEQRSVPGYKKLCELFNIKTNINSVGGKNNKNKTILWAIDTLEECGFLDVDIYKNALLYKNAHSPETNAPKGYI